ncbi:MAG: winged helix-turn-helix domain-containing protein [Clostridia bacterium]|nr:winged helix-turn-helix domain-containing protein [Clostridia bacterium]
MANKMTRKDYYSRLIEIVTQSRVEDAVEVCEFLTHQIMLLDNKSSSSGQTKRQAENDGLKGKIVAVLSANPMSISEITACDSAFAGMSNQRMSQLLSQLIKAGIVERVKEGKVSKFVLA